MVRTISLAAMLAAMLAATAEPASSQATKASAVRSLDPGAAEGPDPLAPPEVEKPAPSAPGAPAALPEAKPPADADPIVTMVRQRLAASPNPATAGERDDLAALVAFYQATSEPVWTGKDGFTARAKAAIGEIRKADDWGLKPSAFDLPALPEGEAASDALAQAEIKLGLAVLKYARHARGGRLDPLSVSRIFDQKPAVYDPRTLMPAVAVAAAVDAYLRDLHPKHPQFERLRQALLAARGAKPDEAAPSPAAKPGEAVQRLIVNMERWRWMPPDLGAFYVWNSVPQQMTMVFKDGKRVLAEKIVVGKPGSPTPVFSADMLFVIFHPSWGVPPGIKVHELWPQLKQAGGGWFFSSGASAVLKSHGLLLSRGGHPVDPDSVDWNKVDVRSFDFTQPPGPKNLLGIVKFRFPNKHNVYMHDTPERHLFGGASRVFSHGCMRVQNPVRLAELLLEHDKGWSADKVNEYVRRGGEIKLTTPIPVHNTYFTADVDDDGKVHYRPDVYGLDGRLASALEGRAVHLVSAATDAREPTAKEAERPPRAKAAAKRKEAPSQPPFNPFGSSSRY